MPSIRAGRVLVGVGRVETASVRGRPTLVTPGQSRLIVALQFIASVGFPARTRRTDPAAGGWFLPAAAARRTRRGAALLLSLLPRALLSGAQSTAFELVCASEETL